MPADDVATTLFSAGYAGQTADAFAAFVEREDLTVADVRLKPFSRMPGWSRKALAARFGDRYVWIPELGNLNYQGGPIRLQDERAGLATLRALLETRAVVVLCVCADPTRCHRTVVTAALAGEVSVRHWPPRPGPSLWAPET